MGALAKKLFGGWKEGGRPVRKGAGETPALQSRVVVIDMPDAGQASIVVGRRGIRRTDPAYMHALVANAVLGGGYSSRLNQEVRIERGLSYGAQSWFEPRADVGPFLPSTDTKHESAAEVVGIVVGEMSRLSTADIAVAELTPRKAALIGDFAFSLETTRGIVQRISALALYGLPLSEIDRYVRSVQAVKAEEVRVFAATHMKGENVNVVVAGDAKQFVDALRKQFEDVEVIGASELDLGSPSLRVRKAKE
ncbi:MAG TPA: insulinase family protein [Thermoanaerobaculia bacterium]|nr:insulinase family protein [Thermoanaerobaculia bacterium]